MNEWISYSALHTVHCSALPQRAGLLAMAWFLLLGLMAFTITVRSQPGFISIDCGIAEGSVYQQSGQINFVSDVNFIDSGINHDLPNGALFDEYVRHYKNVRSFPDGDRNCYTLRPVDKGSKYLIKAGFLYGNYDGQNLSPTFDLYLGVDWWATVQNPTTTRQFFEIITLATMDFVSVCLVNTGKGTPFISVLSLRPLANSMYNATNEDQSLKLFGRFDMGSAGNPIRISYRYPVDPYDRIWFYPRMVEGWSRLQTNLTVRNYDDGLKLPSMAMMTAIMPSNGSDIMYFNWTSSEDNQLFHVYKHYAELVPNSVREMTDCCGSSCYGPFVPPYLVAFTVHTDLSSTGGINKEQYSCWFQKMGNSALPPILNAIEIYTVLQRSKTTTNQEDVYAMMNIKSAYKVKRNWMGDPCFPKNYSWEGLTCRNDATDTAKIIAMDLSSSGLNGEISSHIAKLRSLESLNLSNNSLEGQVPEFLGKLPSLSFLNLTGNQLNGSLPSLLLERSKIGLLTLSVGGNRNLCISGPCSNANGCGSKGSCGKNKRKIIIPVVASIFSSVGLLTVLIILWKHFKGAGCQQAPVKKDQGDCSLSSKNQQFTYAEIINMTSNFERIIGRGGFGTVYYGEMQDGTQVAVKILSEESIKMLAHPSQFSIQFQTEVQILMRIHHRNLVPFIGYCNEGTKKALIYEYMAEGNLSNHLSATDGNAKKLNWGQRLIIALDVAQGLEYLHSGCKPQVVHRDVKTTNILLNGRLEAKIGDFGLSKVFLPEGLTHVSTTVKGTRGYLDPEYCITNKLTEKSDVYSFGIVLLELITGQHAIIRSSNSDAMSIKDWVSPLILAGDISCLVDPILHGDYGPNSVWKAVEIAMACIPPRTMERPTMSHVVMKLKECLETELAWERSRIMNSVQAEMGSSTSLYLPR